MFDRGLGDDRAGEVVRQYVRPDFRSNHFWRIASKDVQLDYCLDRSQIEFDVPVIMPPKLTVYRASIVVVEFPFQQIPVLV